MEINSVTQSSLYEAKVGERERGAWVFGVALGLGVAGAWLFRGQEAGINVLAGTALLGASAGLLLRGRQEGGAAKGWLWVALVFAGCVGWRASGTLNALAIGMVLWCLVLAGAGELGAVARMSIGRAVRHGWETFAHVAGGFLQLVGREIRWEAAGKRPVLARIWSGVVGLLIALPVAFVFATLFSSADAIYRERLRGWLDYDFVEVFSFAIWAGAIWWMTSGYLRKLVYMEAAEPDAEGAAWRPRMGSIELNVVLAVLNVLFLSFVVVQVRYLFGGAEVVEVTPGLGYADYARQGFFELVTAAALVLPLLLLADWLHPEGKGRMVLKILAAILIGLLLVVMMSAAKRMQLYQAEYGLTELRFYVSAFMILLAGVFGWFGVTVLRDRREYFLSGAMAGGALAVLALQVVNPDGWIAEVNLRRGAEGKLFDPEHAAQLSADAWPALMAGLEHLPEEHRAALTERLGSRPVEEQTWREWNWARWRKGQIKN